MQFFKKVNGYVFLSFITLSGCGNDKNDDTMQVLPPPAQHQTIPMPVLGAVTPGKGSVLGGTILTITGSGYTKDTKVTFGENATPATQIQFISSEELRVTTPAGALGAAKITLTNLSTQDGNLTDSNASLFRYSYANIRFSSLPELQSGTNSSTTPTGLVPVTISNGKTALVTINSIGTERSFGVIKQDAMGNWQPPLVTNLAAGTNAVAIVSADVTGDGKEDILIADARPTMGMNIPKIWLYENNGMDNFTTPMAANASTNLSGGKPKESSMVVGDFDGNGTLDVAVAADNIPMIDTAIQFLQGSTMTPGNFTLSMTNAGQGQNLIHLITGDFNGDGKLDIAGHDVSNNTISIFINNNTVAGTISFQSAIQVNAQGVENIVAGDFNGDGKLDIAASIKTSSVIKVLLNDGQGGFSIVDNLNTNMNLNISQPTKMTVGDFDKDGIVDLAVINSNTNNISILLSSGDGKLYGAHQNLPAGNSSIALISKDLNGDGKLDLAVANLGVSGNGKVRILTSQSQ